MKLSIGIKLCSNAPELAIELRRFSFFSYSSSSMFLMVFFCCSILFFLFLTWSVISTFSSFMVEMFFLCFACYFVLFFIFNLSPGISSHNIWCSLSSYTSFSSSIWSVSVRVAISSLIELLVICSAVRIITISCYISSPSFSTISIFYWTSNYFCANFMYISRIINLRSQFLHALPEASADLNILSL